MTFFDKISNKQQTNSNDTSNFFIGTPEAEGESAFNSKIQLGEIFGDYLNIFPELKSEKFIITGRKGAGKSAIAEFINLTAKGEANVFCDFIKTRDLKISKIVQLGKEEGHPVEEYLIFEWLILVKLIELFLKDQSIQSIKEFKDLKVFLQRNSGMVDIKSYEIVEIVKDKSFEINIEYFKRVFNSVFKNGYNSKEHKAPFYKILQPLKEIVLKLLKDRVDSQNEFILIFDDLDIGFKESDMKSIENVTNILRVAKDYNIDFFGKNGLKSKVIILLRDDLKRVIVKHNADTAKVFSSYEIPLVWYEHENFKSNENSVGLKHLINKRFEINFVRENIQFNKKDPWSSFFKNDGFDGSSFKYLIDYTFFRPRDLILLFKPLPNKAFKIPLSFNDSKILVNAYVEELINEIKNELSANFSNNDISIIFNVLRLLKTKQPLQTDDFIYEFEQYNLEYDHEQALIHLFDYSLIGNIDRSDSSFSKIYFKHREQREDPCVINFDMEFIYHKAIEVYLDKRKYTNK